jgi:DNA polymerase sliding clamp subunit (PCNA homolog)
MIFTANKKALHQIMAQAALCVSENPAQPYLCGIHLEAKANGIVTCTGSDHEMAVQASGPAAIVQVGAAVFDSRLIPEIVRKMPTDEVSIETVNNDNQVVLRSGSCVMQVACLPAKGYKMPDLPFPESMMSVQGLPALLRKVGFAAATGQNDKPMLKGVSLAFSDSGLTATACDGYRVAESRGDEECKGNLSIMVPIRAVQRLVRLSSDDSVYQLGMTAKSIVFWDGSMLFTTRALEGETLDTVAILSKHPEKYRVLTTAEGLAQAVGVASVGEQSVCLRMQDSGLLLSSGTQIPDYKDDDIRLLAAYRGTGQSEIRVPAQVMVPSEKPFYYNGQKLLQNLQAMTGQVALLFCERGHVMIVSQHMRIFQMAAAAPKARATPKPKAVEKKKLPEAA